MKWCIGQWNTETSYLIFKEMIGMGESISHKGLPWVGWNEGKDARFVIERFSGRNPREVTRSSRSYNSQTIDA